MTSVLRTGVWRYGSAVVVVVLATGARLLLDPVLGENTPFLTYFPAVAFVAWACGSGPTLLSITLFSVAAAYFFLLPRYSLEVPRQSDQIALGIFVGFGLITAALSEQVRKARQRAERKQRQLEEEGQRWHTTLASVVDAVLVTDKRGTVTFLNGVAETLTGWPQAEAVGRHLDGVFHVIGEGDRRPAENPVVRVIQSGHVQGLANRTILIGRDGGERSIEDSAAPIRGAGGELIGVVLVFRDVTQRRMQERRLRESEARLASIVNHAPAAIFIKDAAGKYLLVNNLFERLAGVGRDRLLGTSDDDLYPTDVAERFGQMDRRILASGRAETFEESFEYDGQPLTFLTTKFPLSDAEGLTYAVCGIATDITERKRAEEALRESERRFRTLAAHAPVGIFQTDAQGNCQFVNERWCELTGLSTKDAEGPGWGRALHPEDRERIFQGWYAAAGAGREFVAEFRFRTPGGTVSWVQCRAVALPNDAGEVTGYLGTNTDITDRKEMEDALKEADRSKAQSLALLDTLQHNAPVGFAFVDRQFRYVRINEALAAINGKTAAEHLGRTIQEMIPSLWPRLEPLYRGVLEKGGPVANQEFTGESPAAPGQVRHWLVSYYPVRIHEEVAGIGILVADMTERKRVEEALREVEARFTAILNYSPSCIFAKDREGRYLLANKALAEFTGRDAADLLGRTDADVFPAEVAARFAADDAELLSSGSPRIYEESFPHADTTVTALTVKFPLLGADGTPYAVCGIATDISDRKRAQDALRESERRWRSLAEALPNLVWTDLPNGQCDYLSSQWGTYTGIPVEELLGMNWLDIVIHPDDRERTAALWQEACADKADYDLEYRIRRHDGVYRWFKTRGVPVRDRQNCIVKWFGTCTDIEDQKQAVEEMRRSEERFRQLADAMPQIVWTARPDGYNDYYNRRWYEFIGVTQGEAGEDAWKTILHADDLQPCIQRWGQSVRSGAAFEMEVRLIDRKTKGYRWHLVRTVPVRNEAGEVVRWYGTSTDTHEQKRAGEAFRFLAESSAALATLVDYESTLQKVANLAVPYFADWSAVDVAREDGFLRRLAVAHLDPAMVELAHDLVSRYPPTPDAPGGIAHVFRTGQPEIIADVTDDMLLRGAKDEEHLRLMRALALKSYICVPLVVSGKALGVLTFATAESGRRYTPSDLALAEDLAHRAAVAIENSHLYRALKEADQRKDEFLATLAHELRNPLAPIRNALQVMRLAGSNGQAVEQSRSMMERQVVQMVRLVDDLLDVSRITRNKLELRRERVELAKVVGSAVETSRPVIEEAGHELTVILPPEPVYLDADPTRLAQVFSNLLNNSAKYTEKGGRIRLTAERQDGEVVVRVRDNGVGIPAEALPRLFEMFSQVDRNLERAQGGLGIGLTLVRRLMEMHGGTVEARSEGAGRGSEFVVTLPLTKDGQGREESQMSGGGEKPVAPKRRILVVDDNRDGAASLSMMLSIMGNETRTAHDGLEAVEAAAAFRPDLILLDIGLPKLNGYDACRQIRQQPWGKGIVIIACTGWGQEEDRRRSNEAGFDRHMVKPVDPAALEELLAGLEKLQR